MPFYSTMVETEIACPAVEVYNYITDPATWADGRPLNDPGWTVVPAGGHPPAPPRPRSPDTARPAMAGWSVLEAEPGRRWIVRSSGSSGTSSITITYSLAEYDGMTHFLRHMEIEVPVTAAVSEHARAALVCAKPHSELAGAIKQALEKPRIPLSRGPQPVRTPQIR